MPGDDTSSVYAPGNGSISSMRSLIHAWAADSSSKLTPSSVSMYTRMVGAFFAPATSTRDDLDAFLARTGDQRVEQLLFLLAEHGRPPVPSSWLPSSRGGRALTNKESGNKPTFSCVESMVRACALAASLPCLYTISATVCLVRPRPSAQLPHIWDANRQRAAGERRGLLGCHTGWRGAGSAARKKQVSVILQQRRASRSAGHSRSTCERGGQGAGRAARAERPGACGRVQVAALDDDPPPPAPLGQPRPRG